MPFDPISASRAVLIEVMNMLGVFRDELVIVGGCGTWTSLMATPPGGSAAGVFGEKRRTAAAIVIEINVADSFCFDICGPISFVGSAAAGSA
jgi:hypothetical protein